MTAIVIRQNTRSRLVDGFIRSLQLKAKLKPYYKNWILSRCTNIAPHKLPIKISTQPVPMIPFDE